MKNNNEQELGSSIENYFDIKKGSYGYTDEEARQYTSRIDIDVDLGSHTNRLVNSTAMMIPDLLGNKVLDVGTGEGRWARYMVCKSASNVFGIDISKKMIEIANDRNTDYDVVFSNNSIKDLPEKGFNFINTSIVTMILQNLSLIIEQLEQLT